MSADVPLGIVAATPELLARDREDPRSLAVALGAELPVDWPPEFHDPSAVRYTEEALASPESAGWWLHYFVASGPPAILVGVGGFKGPPADGLVEIGYSVVPSAQRHGYATEAVRRLIAKARERGASRMRAETLPSLVPSIRVLEKAGFTPAPAAEAGVLGFELDLTEGA